MEALLLGAGGVLIETMEWEPGLGEPPVIRARGGGRECKQPREKSAGLRFAAASENALCSAFSRRETQSQRDRLRHAARCFMGRIHTGVERFTTWTANDRAVGDGR